MDAQRHEAEEQNRLGNLAVQRQDFAAALEHYRAALEVLDDVPEIWFNLGQVCRILGRRFQAARAFRQVTELKPDFAMAWHCLGLTEREPRQAELAFLQALRLKRDASDSWLELGQMYQAQGRYREALGCFVQVARLLPERAEAFNLVGTLHYLLGEASQAIDAYQQALRLDPGHPAAWSNLAGAYVLQRKLPEALQASERSLELNSSNADAWNTLATIQEQSDQPVLARQALQRAQELEPRPGRAVRLALMLPGLYESREQILAERRSFEQRLQALLAAPVRLQDPVVEVGYMPFHLLYHHLPMRDLSESLARFYLRACPELAWCAPDCAPACATPRPLPERIRIGFVSHFFRRHSIGRLFQGLIEQIDKKLFEVTVFMFAEPADEVARRIAASADHCVILPPSLLPARHQIAASAQDLLFYTDIGMSPLTYFLAFARLAPLQCVTWGHGVTTGIPTLDAYVSSQSLETESSRQDYSEKLLLMKHLLPCFDAPAIPPEVARKQRSDYDLPSDQHLYICPQSPFKLHPDFDAILAGILRRDAQGLILLLEGYAPTSKDFLQARFARHLPDVAERIRFMPRQPEADFLQVISLSEVMLDTFPIGGGNTTYDALVTGTPIVTLEGSRPSSRLTAACLRQIDFTDTIVETPEQYVDLAVRLGTDSEFRARISEALMARAPRLYTNRAAVRELEQMLRGWMTADWPK